MTPSSKTYTNAAIGPEAPILHAIHQPQTSIAILQRDTVHLKQEVVHATEADVKFQVSGPKNDIKTQLRTYLGETLPNCQALLADIEQVLDHFEAVTKAGSFRLLLTTVRTNMCRKFHTDINDLRMLCTYAGPGTLWLPEEAILPVRSISGEMELDDAHIQQVDTGDIVILKGALYEDGKAIMHRSPTIEEMGEARLLLRIDTNAFKGLTI